MTSPQRSRVLLSHNFALSAAIAEPLSRETFAQAIAAGLATEFELTCTAIDHPHWVAAVQYDPSLRSPQEVGRCCGEALAHWRQAQVTSGHAPGHIVLVLGGCKTTPATGAAAIALQPGEWGVDVVETQYPDQFLADLNWPAMIAEKPPNQIFQVEVKVAP